MRRLFRDTRKCDSPFAYLKVGCSTDHFREIYHGNNEILTASWRKLASGGRAVRRSSAPHFDADQVTLVRSNFANKSSRADQKSPRS